MGANKNVTNNDNFIGENTSRNIYDQYILTLLVNMSLNIYIQYILLMLTI